jgi:hypothetical protein
MNIPSERPSVIITDDINRFLQYLHGLEGDRQRDNQGIHDHLWEIQNELHGLADYIHEKEAPAVLPPAQFKDQSVGWSVLFRSPREAPPPIPSTATVKAGPHLVPISLTLPHASVSPSFLSDSMSFLSYHSDNFRMHQSLSPLFYSFVIAML